MSRYKAYIFDFDLTLVDSTKPIVACFKHILKSFGYDIPDDQTIIDTIGLPLTDAFDILSGITPTSPMPTALWQGRAYSTPMRWVYSSRS